MAHDCQYSANSRLEPRAVWWYRLYCIILALLYLLCVGFGAGMLLLTPETLEMERFEQLMMVAILCGFGLPLLVACILPLLFAPRPWLWVYGLLLIALGLTSCCFWPICIPLLLQWIKPEVQAHFGRDGGGR